MAVPMLPQNQESAPPTPAPKPDTTDRLMERAARIARMRKTLTRYYVFFAAACILGIAPVIRNIVDPSKNQTVLPNAISTLLIIAPLVAGFLILNRATSLFRETERIDYYNRIIDGEKRIFDRIFREVYNLIHNTTN